MEKISKKLNSGCGFWIYGIRRTSSYPKIKGIFTYPLKDIEALLSYADLAQFNDRELSYRVQNDTKWLEDNVRHHHSVLQEAYQTGIIIPMKFGLVFKTKKSLEKMLNKYYEKFNNLLLKLGGKEEWGIKIGLALEKFKQNLNNPSKVNPSLPLGMKWYFQKKNEEEINKNIDQAKDNYLQEIQKVLKQSSEEIQLIDSLTKNFGENSQYELILSAACLIPKSKIEIFKEKIMKLANGLEKVGFLFELTGPWPPYNFIYL